ncbi:hypothetical protein [Streptomyces sp. AP-93]|uniref:hypothetical protein n=1 Tax=Streptomyces sp. AP-93 TaxID=2929048 RepID=UPI001FAED12F|nr:hypothetical protein [Streptomyces sp. AP-93]MCJ0870135.1 hypothetical protein [Streptomyces sp. AP-93]
MPTKAGPQPSGRRSTTIAMACWGVSASQLLGIAMIGADELGVSTLDVLNLGTSLLVDAWKETSGPMTYLFLALGGSTAFQSARKAA